MITCYFFKLLRKSLLQGGHCFGERIRFVVFEDLSAVVQRSSDNPETFLVADLDRAIVVHPFGDRRENRLDLRLFGSRLDRSG